MKPIIILLMSLFILSCPKARAMESINAYQWKNRILIVGVSGNGDRYVESLRERDPGIVDRDIVWFVADSGGIRSNIESIDESLARSVKSFIADGRETPEVILIGKDGGVKKRADALDIDALFNQIDAMPMRIREMRQK